MALIGNSVHRALGVTSRSAEPDRIASLADRALVLTFSAVGRMVQANGTAGTDHGTPGPGLLAGPKVTAGLWGTP
jgi:uncharacterized protein (DUF1501 family)